MNNNDIVTDSFVRPVWQLPVRWEERSGNFCISQKAKYHCFVENHTLCGMYWQNTSDYDDGITTKSGSIAQNPNIACSRCLRLWKNRFCEVSENER